MISVGDRLPETILRAKGPDGPYAVDLADRLKGRKVILFGLPGAFTPTCDSAHLPSFIRTAPAFRDNGIDEIICFAVNDVHVMTLWGEQSGAAEAGITLLSDGDGAFTSALGLTFDNPGAAMFGRTRRHAMVVEDGIVTVLHLEEPGVCAVSTGEAMLEAMG